MSLRLLFAASAAVLAAAPALSQTDLAPEAYIAAPIVAGVGSGGEAITGVVFDDENRDGARSDGEQGVAGVLVSNGLDWTRTDENGRYEIAVREDFDLTILQPSGWRVPTDARLVPQFSYTHKAGGTGYEMRYGGLPDTGPAPGEVHFPLTREGAPGEAFACAIVGDSQTYSNQEISWLRDGVVTDLVRDREAIDCLLYVGDVVGDDLDLLDRVLEIGAAAGAPQWLVHGNHDFDFDARSDADSADSWRRLYGPNYYAFDIGRARVVVLDNVIYPCGPEDAATGHEFCAEGERATYNGRLTETQFQWLEGLIEETPQDRLIVLAHHIPFVSFVDAGSNKHQTDDLDRIHALVQGREALSLSGHTHTIENHAPGQIFEGWSANTGTEPLPFRHIIAGAASGAWFQGDFNIDGNPMTLQRMGAPSGYIHLAVEGTAYAERYVGQRVDPTRGQWIGLNTPAFRDWYDAILAWAMSDRETRDTLPPASINDLPDTGILTPEDLAGGVWLTANVWAGSAETTVEAMLSDGTRLDLARTQDGEGEAPKIGAQWADPFAAQRQLSVARYALQSTSGDARAQGVELFQGARFGPGAPQPQRALADRNMHLWRARLPEDLSEGVHTATITSADRNGRTYQDTIVFEVRAQRPQPYFRSELWSRGEE